MDRQTRITSRLPQLDAIRGLALWGILIVNVVWFSIPPARFGELYGGGPHWYNDVINFLRTEWFGGRSATLFALLFGLGLSMQWLKWESVSLLLKRNLVLAAFGVVHILLLLGGDILLDYALFGFLGVFLLLLDKRWSLVLAIFLMVYPSILMLCQEMNWVGALGPGSGGLNLNVEEMEALFQRGDFIDQINYRIHQYVKIWRTPWVLNFYFPPVLGCFFVGLYLGRTGFLKSFNNLTLYRNIVLATLAYKLGVTVVNHSASDVLVKCNESFGFQVLFQWDQYVTSLLMIALVVSTINSPVFRWIWKPFQVLGRMSLTTYILESLLASWVFYSFGLAQYNILSPLQVQMVGLLIFIFILTFCYFWQKKYRYGPLE